MVELHLSNPAAREPFRHTSVLAPVADGMVAGFGGLGYELAVDAVAALLKGARPMTTTTRANPYAPATTALPPLTVTGRLDRLRAAFDEHEVDALVVTTLANIRYLTGFAGLGRRPHRHPRRRAPHHRRPLPDPVGRAAGAGRRGRPGRNRDRPAGGTARGGPGAS